MVRVAVLHKDGSCKMLEEGKKWSEREKKKEVRKQQGEKAEK